MTEAIKVLNVNGRELNAKGSFFFVKKADEKYKETDANGNKTDGVSSIYNQLLSYDLMALIKFWDCATAHLVGAQPTEEEITSALEQSDIDGLFKGALEVLERDGFFRGKTKHYWSTMDLAVKREKDEEKKQELAEGISMLKEMRDMILNS